MSEFSNQGNAAGEPKKKKKRGGLALIIGGAVVAAAVGGVFAANSIGINADSNRIEFGQGVADTLSCTSTATTSIDQAWDGTANSPYGAFQVSKISVNGIDAEICANKVLKVLLIKSDGTIMCDVDGNSPSGSGKDQFVIGTDSAPWEVDLTDYLISADCLASDVGKIGLETADQ